MLSVTIFCLFAIWRFHTHSNTQTHALGATAGASDYAVKPNQFPVFGLMDAIIFMDLKQVRVPRPPPPPPPPPQPDTHMHTLNEMWSLTPLRRYGSVNDVKIFVVLFSIWLKRHCTRHLISLIRTFSLKNVFTSFLNNINAN